jgi:hypothetical protein
MATVLEVCSTEEQRSVVRFNGQKDKIDKTDHPVARPLPAHRTAQTENKRTEASMPQVGFKLRIPVFQQAKTVHALDCAATVIGSNCI